MGGEDAPAGVAAAAALSVPPWKQGEDAALSLRHRMHLSDGPVNVWDTIRRLGIALALEDFGPHGGDGRYLNKGGRALIVVNRAITPVARQRFTAAHELGHHELHRHGRATTVIRDDDILGAANDPVEQAANSFAATFLAPAAGVREALAGERRRNITPEDVVSLMGEFGLSYRATVYRLSSAGVVNRPQREALLDAGEGNIEWMLAEAAIDEAKLFPAKQPLPGDYVERVVTLWRNRFISDVRFAEMLRMTADQATEWRERHRVTRPELPDYDRDTADKLLHELGG